MGTQQGSSGSNVTPGPRRGAAHPAATTWLLLGIGAVAAAIRLWTLDGGLPYLYHPDEPVNMTVALHMVQNGDWNPHFFNYPSLFFYLNAGLLLLEYGVGHLTGLLPTRAALSDPLMLTLGVGKTLLPATFLLARLLTLAFALGAIGLVFQIARQISGNRAVGLGAALFLALSPTAVANSRYITPDTSLVCFVLLAFWGALTILQQGSAWAYGLAGIAAGLVESVKYNGGLIIVALLLAHGLRYGRQGVGDRRIYLALALAVGAFFATTPFALLDYSHFVADVQSEAQHYASGHMGMEGNTFSWYSGYLWSVEGGITVLAVLGLGWALYRRAQPLLLLAAFPVVYFVFINRFEVRNDRTLLPLLPFLCILSAWLLGEIARLLRRRDPATPWLRGAILTGLVGGLVAGPCGQIVQDGISRMDGVNTREQARAWLETQLPAHAPVVLEAYTPYLDAHRFTVRAVTRLIDHPADWYAAQGVAYLVAGEGMYGRFYREPARYADEVQRYDTLFQQFTLLTTIRDPSAKVSIRIYAVAPSRTK